MEIFTDEIKSIEESYSTHALKFFHFNSLKNFVRCFDSIKNEKDKIQVKELLEEYFEVIQSEDCVTKEISQQFYINYIEKIARYYIYQAGFRRMPRLGGMIVVGLLLDGMLLLFGMSKFIGYIPIFTILGVGHYINVSISYKRIHRVFGYQF